jgi:predicted nucleotidyltransferase component of viral defense system
MIAPAYITEWSQQCPWISPAQVEQDLVLSRGLVEIYSDPILRERLLFRGGTALHKIVLQPAARYSEDLDFVQLREEPIGDTLDLIRLRLNPWLGEPKSDIGPRGATLTYRFESELPPVIRLRLKIEINTREHLCLLPIQQTQFTVDSRWFSGEASLPIYSTTELLGTKLRALYQRRKGRDLFDLWQARQAGVLDAPAVADIFAHYMMSENNPVAAAEFIPNITAKMNHTGFLSDTPPLLRPGIQYNAKEAAEWLTQHLIPHIP